MNAPPSREPVELAAELPAGALARVRWWRYLYRSPMLAWHLLIHLPVALLLISLPGSTRPGSAGTSLSERAIGWWSRGLLRVFGMRTRRIGEPHATAALLVANHISWLDIELIHSHRAVHFVAKSEIGGWPLIGWLASRAGTIYHRRGSTQSLQSVSAVMAERLRAGHPVGVFPEGGTGDGSHVRVFHARIFQTALDAAVPIQPVALRYRVAGQFSPFVAFGDGESFMGNFLRLLGGPPIEAETHFLPLVADAGEGRRRLAETCRQRIAEIVQG
ncbi:MAG: 1-acyl-sn-glycerol-3-phosphate acyltransferase [Xanthomonadales bacterium]|nr:1-acyl-sn-glycerol-3-phosphate acyltransferase [Xanthomonadales bacterium]